ncbi:hypothetical protein DAT299_16880 [Streptococcus suis]|uniref:hypothetical protein n=1 Tax=Streptococcus suis TaxID=1307 RepID=UPI00059B126B|nr:hypothetical protein [Streptococcus suis]BCK44124.1 hypothetical protein DAT299_16880 [Streptococcus suis]
MKITGNILNYEFFNKISHCFTVENALRLKLKIFIPVAKSRLFATYIQIFSLKVSQSVVSRVKQLLSDLYQKLK